MIPGYGNGRFLAVDPDTKNPGIAVFKDGTLVDAEAMRLGIALYEASRERALIECPQTYGGRAARGDANDLITLARIVGRFEQVASSSIVVLPSQWKGQVPKDVMSVRVWEVLTTRERDRCEVSDVIAAKLNKGVGVKSGKASDVLDAVGIGLWALGRL